MGTSGRFFPVQTFDLGPSGSFASFNEASLRFPGQLGMVVEADGKVYRLVKHTKVTATVATSAGFVAHWRDRAAYTVVSDQTDAVAGVNGPAGAFLGVVTEGNYCFVQMGGLQNVSTAALVVAGDKLIGSTTDGQFARIAAGTAPTDEVWAIAYGAVSGGKSDAYWMLGKLL